MRRIDRPVKRWGLVSLGFFLASVVTDTASADASPGSDTKHSLLASWEAPEGCMSEAELEAAIAQQFPQGSMPSERSLQGKVTRGSDGYEVRFEVRERGRSLGTRRLTLPPGPCRSHDEALALVSALLLEHGPPRAPVEEKPAHDIAPSTQSSKAPQKEAQEKLGAPEHRPTSPSYRLVAGGTGLMGLMPSALSGVVFGGAVSWWEGYWLDVRGQYWLPAQASQSGRRLKSYGGDVVLRGCMESSGRFAFRGCIGGGWVGLRVRALGALESRSVLLSSALAQGELGGVFRLDRSWSANIWGDIRVPFQSGRYVIVQGAEMEQVFETRSVLPGFGVGVTLTF